MRVVDVIAVPVQAGFFFDDQLAIRAARHGVVISAGRSFHPAEPPGSFLTESSSFT